MTFPVQQVQLSLEALAEEFFRQSEGHWRSERRYYTLKDDAIQEVVSLLTVQFLDRGSVELIELAQLHQLADETALVCGAKTTWTSNYTSSSRKESTGSTIFGVLGAILYRDRGFATTKPVTAEFDFRDAKTMHLRTEYSGSVFEEELKLIGSNYRTRQTIISRAGEEQMIGQYLEKRLK
jgi:hypothetical protein